VGHDLPGRKIAAVLGGTHDCFKAKNMPSCTPRIQEPRSSWPPSRSVSWQTMLRNYTILIVHSQQLHPFAIVEAALSISE